MDVADLTLDELRLALAPGIAEAAIFDGWSDAALDMAADQLGLKDVAFQELTDEEDDRDGADHDVVGPELNGPDAKRNQKPDD